MLMHYHFFIIIIMKKNPIKVVGEKEKTKK